MKAKIKETFFSTKEYFIAFVRWMLLACIVGLVCGHVGAGFAHSIEFVTSLRGEYPWLVLLLPAGGLLSVGVYKLLRVSGYNTNQVLKSARDESKVPILLGPAIFFGSVMSHLFGASAGREGAALQLGGSVSSLLCKIFRLDKKTQHILTMCGMGAVFSALFGTPLGACVFALEVVSVGHLCSAAVFPCLISSISAYLLSSVLGVKGEHFLLNAVPQINIDSLWKVFVIAVAGALIAMLFCFTLHKASKLFTKLFKNEFLRIAVGGTVIILLTILVGSSDYNGGGVHVIERIVSHNEVNFEAFILKILFTAISIGAGFKGGEIIPTMFIGSTMGGTVAILIGLNPGFGAAIGIASMFCGVTNCPIATIILCIELFGAEGAVFFGLAAAIGFLLSGKASLYSQQKFIYSKLSDDINEDSDENNIESIESDENKIPEDQEVCIEEETDNTENK